ncbi:hypothetical protein SAMN05421770_101954 [Granulicella rosea]|uniref:NHL repeat containing protein n=1 Tax=Granulicella rosea TaxID=474952 RepID=A0A239EFN6_9BACT|nr:hypothetical protein [Granulicella rosea]SNS43437.1 hypothetical protein SAMN05421770_101954 [Granulicella rosea]
MTSKFQLYKKDAHNVARKALTAAGATLGMLLATGCAANFSALSNSLPDGAATAGSAIGGRAFGGQQPISGALIQLYAVGTTGYGSTATPLITGTTIKTNVNGGFTLPTNSYTCPAGSYVYITATGGDPGLGTGTNSSIALMAALGLCSNLTSTTFININELTTVAGVWSMAQFGSTTGTALSGSAYPATPSDSFGTSATNTQGIANAMAIANVLVNTTTGTTPGTNTTGNVWNVETWHLNTLADILAACVNSAGANASACSTLFTNTNSATDTLQAALYMAKNPTSNVAAIAAIPIPSAPFVPYDTTVNDFTIGLSYQTGTLAPRFVAIDQFGNAWVVGNTNVYELDPTGNVISTIPSYTLNGASTAWKTAYQVALDTANNAWIIDQSGFSVVGITGSNATGAANGGVSTAVSTGTLTPEGIAVDGSNNVWYSTNSSKLYELAKGAYTTPVAGATTTVLPYGVAVDLSNNPSSPNYAASNGGSFVYAVNQQGCSGLTLGGTTTSTYGGSMTMAYTTAGTSTAAGAATALSTIGDAACAGAASKVANNSAGYAPLSTPAGIAVDNGNNLWVIDQNYTTADTSGPKYSLTKFSENYSASLAAASVNSEISFASYSGAGLSTPWYLAIDGASAVWTANSQGTTSGVPGGTVSAFTNAGAALSPTTGLYGGVYSSTVGTTTTTSKRTIVSARGVAVDPSGNLWVANSATFTPSGASSAIGFVTVMVGAATPTVTPLSRGIANYTLASKP